MTTHRIRHRVRLGAPSRFDANGDIESVQEIAPGSQPHGAARKSRRNR
ncbi:hypothetical protein [uncultured Cardiobacterium sp.]|nr:hypothetical protein [uncultured Cardiobacterium sp.]